MSKKHEQRIQDDAERAPCDVCVRKDDCKYECFVFKAYINGAVFDPMLVRSFIK